MWTLSLKNAVDSPENFSDICAQTPFSSTYSLDFQESADDAFSLLSALVDQNPTKTNTDCIAIMNSLDREFLNLTLWHEASLDAIVEFINFFSKYTETFERLCAVNDETIDGDFLKYHGVRVPEHRSDLENLSFDAVESHRKLFGGVNSFVDEVLKLQNSVMLEEAALSSNPVKELQTLLLGLDFTILRSNIDFLKEIRNKLQSNKRRRKAF